MITLSVERFIGDIVAEHHPYVVSCLILIAAHSAGLSAASATHPKRIPAATIQTLAAKAKTPNAARTLNPANARTNIIRIRQEENSAGSDACVKCSKERRMERTICSLAKILMVAPSLQFCRLSGGFHASRNI
jgi:hypothetical protein